MSEEEKKAIKWLERAEFFSERLYAPIILNLIKKQQKEIEKYKNVITNLNNNWISKEQIREKMRYYQELYKQDNSPNEFLVGSDCLSKLSILSELLEE